MTSQDIRKAISVATTENTKFQLETLLQLTELNENSKLVLALLEEWHDENVASKVKVEMPLQKEEKSAEKPPAEKPKERVTLK